ncbi:unnamed protein product [Adineta steineri]|uniref:RING-type domain-containing protein n=1 Tax=Adineta steineri TaxID=433720 RepID=A0A813VWB4_9BILA|nr:unnamed protein product [Adineta steineri]CAF4083244.1 unnamed protein product [Adineta steineri]
MTLTTRESLDELIRDKKSSYKYTKNLEIIEDNSGQFFVILKMNGNERLDLADESSPSIVCPVIDIRKITHAGGICYGDDSSWIRWPVTTTEATDENEYAIWLHDQLIEISDAYKERLYDVINIIFYPNDNQSSSLQINEMTDTHSFLEAIVKYEQRLRDEPYNEPLRYNQGLDIREDQLFYTLVRKKTASDIRLSALIHEEKNHQRFKIERQSTTGYWYNPLASIAPAPAQCIAKFRLDHEHNKQVVNMDMQNKQNTCTVCMEDLKINEFYARWPCPRAHLFHYDCMLKLLRTRNTCPNFGHGDADIPAISFYR